MIILLQLLKLLPTIIEAVIAIEGVVTAPKAGAAKKQIVLDCAKAAAQAGEQSDDKLVAAIAAVVDNVVRAFNGAGVFKQS